MLKILLPTYNGEKYVAELIDSLLAQTYRDFKLYIQDDKSTDGTLYIVTKYAMENPDRVIAYQNEENTGGAKHNFLKMMIEYKDDYIMLCDQDDLWLPDKIEKSLRKMKEMESAHGASTPLLVHTDLKVVDDNLKVIRSSYRRMANTSYKFTALNNLVTMNVATGCTIIYNRALANLFTAEPESFVMHDWWVALTATAFGKIGSIRDRTVLYRQHTNNEVGAKKVRSVRYVRYVLTHIDIMAGKLYNSYRQAGSFLKMYDERLSDEQKELLAAHASMPELTKRGKLRLIFKYKTFLCGTARKIAQVIVLLSSGKEPKEPKGVT